MKVLDLFSAAAGGWSLGMHRAGYVTIAACEAVEWRRILYAQNNPGIPIYDDVVTLTAERLLRDIGELPAIIVGSPPCQDISSANTKGKGVEGERSSLFFEAVRLIGECRPRWFALENSANLRTRGADAVLAALEELGYACWPLVVRASDIGANHERPRSWLIGCDLRQVTDADSNAIWLAELPGRPGPKKAQPEHADFDAAGLGHEGGRSRRHGAHGIGTAHVGHTEEVGCGPRLPRRCASATGRAEQPPCGDAAHTNTDQAGQADGCVESGLRQEEIADDGCGDGRGTDGPCIGQMAVRTDDSAGADRSFPFWSLDDLAARIRMDDGLPGRLAGTRVAVGGPRGTSAASLIVEAYGDAVVPQIPEAIGRAIFRVERAMATLTERLAA